MNSSKIKLNEFDFYKPDVKVLSKYIKDKKMLEFPLYSLTVKGSINNTHPAFINGLLRACFELNHYALDCDYEKIKKEDENINIIMLQDNLRLVPLRYGIKEEEIKKLVMNIDITNKSEDNFYVKTGDIRVNQKIDPLFLPNIPLIALGKGKRLVIKDIKIVKGNNFDHVRFSPITATYTASSKTPVREMESGKKLRDFDFKFHINTVLGEDKKIAYDILSRGCDAIIERLGYIITAIKTKDVEYIDIDKDTLTINYPETNTISRIIFIALNLELKNLKFISSVAEINENMVTVITHPEVQSNTVKVLEKVVKYYNDLSQSISS